MSKPFDPNAGLIVPVEGIGTFTFAMRTIGNQFKIESEYCRLTEGISDVTIFLGNLAESVSDLSVLVVSGPKGWASREDILAKDAFVPETYAEIRKVWSALRDKEASFRGLTPKPQEGGQGDVGDDGSVVSPEVPPAAD